jgi:CMP-N-acetylneuraminic acid synthetase
MVTGKTQSQSQKKFYHPNGVINCLYIKSLNKKNKSIYPGASPLVVPRSESFDLDTKDDLKVIKKLLV